MEFINTDPQTGKTLILNRSVRFWLLSLTGLILLITILIAVLNTALIRVSYSFNESVPNESIRLTTVDPQGNDTDVSTFFGDFALVPRSTAAIRATGANVETQAVIPNLPFFSIPNFHLKLQSQSMVSKTGAQTLGCNLANPFGTYTYNCSAPETIAQIRRPPNGIWDTQALDPLPFIVYERYGNGFLGLERLTGNPVQATYYVPGGASKTINLPSEFKINADDNITVITDQSDSQNAAFIVANSTTGEFVKFNNTDDTNPQRFNRSAETNALFNFGLCAMNKTKLTCYYGPGAHDHNNTDEHTQYRETEGTIGRFEVIPFDNPDQRTIAETNELEGADRIYLAANDRLFARKTDLLYNVDIKGEDVNINVITKGLIEAGVSGNSLFYTAYGGLYQFDSDQSTAYLRYRADRQTTPSISVYGNEIIINAFVDSNDNGELRDVAHSYRLTDTPWRADQPRKEDFLPYEFEPPITYMDYSDNQIYIGLEPVYATDPRTFNIRIDNNLTRKQEDRIKQRLADDGLLTPDTKLLFRW